MSQPDSAAPPIRTPALADVFLRPFTKLSSVQPGERVIDLESFGHEAVAEAAARAGDSGEVLIARRDAATLEEVAAQCRAQGLSALRYEQTSGERLAQPDAYWDIVLCHFGLTALDDPESVLKEMIRVLRPVGRVSVSVLGEADRCLLISFFTDAVGKHLPAVKNEARRLFRFGEPGKLANLLADTGYQDAVPERATEWVPFADVDAYWEYSLATPYGAPARHLSPEAVAECKAELERKLRFYRRGSHYELKVEAIILAAVK
jgi:ubiquinone/menaquinone biosynthesis C-methylase UbiE